MFQIHMGRKFEFFTSMMVSDFFLRFISILTLKGTKHIVGYCLPLKTSGEIFKEIPPARVVRVVESPLINEQFLEKYKVNFCLFYS